ncbi:MAG: helix-turn-helix transcriptional regulator [Bacillota bacterium]|nr:helix-turn-helix transcriptional regulator [Bacillota bacterium]
MDTKYHVIRLMPGGTEKKGFVLDRPNGTDDYLLIHFKSPVLLLQEHEIKPIEADTCILFPPGTPHWFSSLDCQLVHDWVHFTPKDPERLFSLGIPINKTFMLSRVDFITMELSVCHFEIINHDFMWEESVSAHLELLLIRIARELSNENKGLNSRYLYEMHDRFNKFRLELYRQSDKDWDIDKMADCLSLSRSRFSVLYRLFYDISPKEDLISARLNRAKSLLQNSSLTVAQVAELSGYTNTYHFIRQFKEREGIPPNTFRKQIIPADR